MVISFLLTVPQLRDLKSICVLEYLSPVKYNISNTCYIGPITREDLALVTCPNSRTIIHVDDKNKCLKGKDIFVCPELAVPKTDDAEWLGMYWMPNSKVTFKRRHTISFDCEAVQPLFHLGGRYYLATTNATIQIRNKTNQLLELSPLSVYSFPCDVTIINQETGLGKCPETFSIPFPILNVHAVSYVLWKPGEDETISNLHYNSLKIPPPVEFDQNTTEALDKT